MNPRLTPTLDALGRQAVVFDQAITVAPLTLPAHASLLTGQYPPHDGVRDNETFALDRNVDTFPVRVKRHGYATAAFVSAVVLDRRYGLDNGFDVYDDQIAGPERPAAETLARAERWGDAAPHPFLLWVHLFEPHAPYRTGSYAGEVAAVDGALGGFFAHLRATGVWSDLVVSVTADHGESLGEHGEKTHGFFLYDATLHIPWILKAPGLTPHHVTELARIVDEMPTIIDLAGMGERTGQRQPTDGVSLAAGLAGGEGPGEAIDAAYSETFLPRDRLGWSALKSVRTGRFKYIGAPQPELYDLTSDAGEAHNIEASRPDEAGRLKRMLGAITRSSVKAQIRGGSDPLIAEQLRSLGYVGYSPTAAGAEDATLPDPKSKILVYTLTMDALELSEQGKLEAALRAIERAERLDRGAAQVEFVKGTILGNSGRYRQAVPTLERAVTLSPAYTAARFKLALAWLRLQRPGRAADALREVVRQRPDDFRAWHNLAAIAYSQGDLDQAETFERKAVALSPEYAQAWNTLGATALGRKDAPSAIDALTRATHLAPRDARAFRNLSLAFRAAGHRENARAAAARACAIDRAFCSDRGR